MEISCYKSEEPGKKEVLLIFEREELIYDIRNVCYVEGHILTDVSDEQRHTVQDVGEEGNADIVTRRLDLTHADIVERLYPFTQRDIDNPVIIDKLHEKPVYGIVMLVPDKFSQTTLNLLGKLIHELIVTTTVKEWLRLTNPNKAAIWQDKEEGLLKRLLEVRQGKRGKRRIKQHWFN